MASYDEECVPVERSIDLHDLLERIKGMDQEIIRIEKNKSEAINVYRNERDKLDAHYEMVVNRAVDPGPVNGMERPWAGHSG